MTQAPRISARVEITAVPTTPLYGNYEIIDRATGLQMWRGLYVNPETGKATEGRVEEDLWAEAVAMTCAIDAEIAAKCAAMNRMIIVD